MSEWFLLLLPLAAASGWWAALRSAQRAGGGGAPDPAYFRGLNYLLDDQPDKAIDVFVKLAEMDSETADVQLALGGLFDRAEVFRQTIDTFGRTPDAGRTGVAHPD